MNLSLRNAAMLLAIATLALAAVFFYQRTQSTDIEVQNRVMLNLHELGKLDAELNVDILRMRLAQSATDGAPPLLARMHLLQAQLDKAIDKSDSTRPRQAYYQLRRALHDKEMAVDQLKTTDRALQAALADFAPAISDLKTELAGIEGATVPGRQVRQLDNDLNTLLTDVLRYNQAPDTTVGARIDATLSDMNLLKNAFSPAVDEVLSALVAKARVVLRQRPVENALQTQIEKIGAGQAIDSLAALLDKEFDRGLVAQQRFRACLIAYAALLLALLLYATHRLRRSYSIIGEVNLNLKSANDMLEQRVAARTAELEQQTERLAQLAQHDSLTGLINYGQLTRLLEHALVRAARRDSTVVVMFIDLDGFKGVNDTYGHATGDQVLITVAQRVHACLRAEDALARLGGDEFVILLEEVNSQAGALRVAEQALGAVRQLDRIDDKQIAISASIGVSAARGKGGAANGAAALLAEADQAMYAAKQAGKNRVMCSESAQWSAPAGA